MMRNVTRALLVAAAVAPFVAGARVPEFRCRGLTRSAASGGVRPLGAAASGGGGEGGGAFSLASVRASLIRQEETIIFNLIERTQFAANGPVYAPLGGDVDVASVVDGRLGAITGASTSFLDVMLFETEQVHARARRYLSPEEHPFFPENVADAALEPLDYGDVLYDDGQNVNAQIRDAYLQYVLPRGCAAGDDGQHGSCVVADVTCLQSLSRRVHFGKFVAESKLAEDGAAFAALAAAGDIAGIHAKLENVAVEDAVVRRAMLKAVTFGQDAVSGLDPAYKVDPRLVASIYRSMIIPLTKQVQVTYLLTKLGHGDKVPKTPGDWPPYLRAFALEDKDETEPVGY